MKALLRKSLTLLVVLALGLGAINFAPTNAKADKTYVPSLYGEDIKNTDIKYTFDNGTLTAEGKGYADASYTCKKTDIKRIIIKNGIKGIADYAFSGCGNIQYISISSSVKEIGFYAFSGSKLPTMTVPNTVRKIGATAFYTAEPFSINMPGDFQLVWNSYLEESDSHISHGFKNVNLNSSYNPANKDQFDSSNVNTIKGDSKYKSYNGVVYSKNGKTLVQVPSKQKKINIRKGCTKILMSSLLYYHKKPGTKFLLSKAKKITIPESVKKITNDMGSVRPRFGSKTKWIVKTKKLTGNSIENLLKMMSNKQAKKYMKTKEANIKKVNNMRVIKNSVLLKYTGKSKTVRIPSKITRIADGAFAKNKKIKKVILNKKLKSIGNNAFRTCTKLRTVVWNKKLKSVGDYGFSNCNIKTLKMPKSVTKWGMGCFEQNGTTKIKFSTKMKTIPDYMFAGIKIKSIVVPKTVERIGRGAFAHADCKTITINEGTKVIGDYAFDGIFKLNKVVIAKSVQLIRDSSFRDATIKQLILKNPSVTIDEGAFGTIKAIDCGNNPKKYITVASLWETNNKGYCKFGVAKVEGADGMDVEISEKANFSNAVKVNNLPNRTTSYEVKRPSDNYSFYRIRVFTTVKGQKQYGPWKSFKW